MNPPWIVKSEGIYNNQGTCWGAAVKITVQTKKGPDFSGPSLKGRLKKILS